MPSNEQKSPASFSFMVKGKSMLAYYDMHFWSILKWFKSDMSNIQHVLLSTALSLDE